MKMKKSILALLLALCLAASLATPAFAEGETFNAHLDVVQNEDGSITVQIPAENEQILQEQQPTLSIPCGFEAAQVTRSDGSVVACTVTNGQVSFVVDRAGAYTITAVLPELSLSAVARTADSEASIGDIAISSPNPIHKGDEVTLTAPSLAGYRFLGWFIGETKLADTLSYTFNMTEDLSLVALYEVVGSAKVTIYTVNGAAYTINDDPAIQSGSTEFLPLGTELVLTAVEPDKVLRWENSSHKLLGTGESLNLTVVGDTEITLVYQGAMSGQSYLQFVTDYDQVLQSKMISERSNISFPGAPSKFGYSFVRWVFQGTEEEATAESIKAKVGVEPTITVKPLYTRNSDVGTVTIRCKAGESIVAQEEQLTGLPVGSTRTFSAPEIEGYRFERWTDEAGNLLSYSREYFMQITGDHVIVANYVTDDQQVETRPVIVASELTAITSGSTHKLSFLATRSVPETYEVMEQGVLYGKDLGSLTADEFIFGTEGVKRYMSNDLGRNGATRLNYKVSSDSTEVFFRGYMLLRDTETGNTEYYYTEIVSGTYAAVVN